MRKARDCALCRRQETREGALCRKQETRKGALCCVEGKRRGKALCAEHTEEDLLRARRSEHQKWWLPRGRQPEQVKKGARCCEHTALSIRSGGFRVEGIRKKLVRASATLDSASEMVASASKASGRSWSRLSACLDSAPAPLLPLFAPASPLPLRFFRFPLQLRFFRPQASQKKLVELLAGLCEAELPDKPPERPLPSSSAPALSTDGAAAPWGGAQGKAVKAASLLGASLAAAAVPFDGCTSR